jgi:tetratricopeptide (TPR) repeat protein
LALAIRQLRIEGTPGVALASLEDYQTRFPASALEPEAEALRVEALLALGRKAQALAAVDELLARPRPGNDGRRVLRGEIRMSLGAWRDALTDFEAALAGPGGAESGRSAAGFVERALWGRAVSRGRLGDDSGARAALEEYLGRFPQGRFAGGAARALGQRP